MANICLPRRRAKRISPRTGATCGPAMPTSADYDDGLRAFLHVLPEGLRLSELRLGDLAEGRVAVEKLLELDPSDKIGAELLLDILERSRRRMTTMIDGTINEAIDWLVIRLTAQSCAHSELFATRPVSVPLPVSRIAMRDGSTGFCIGIRRSPTLRQPSAFRGARDRGRTAPLFRAFALFDDPEETVRWNAASRLPNKIFLRMRTIPIAKCASGLSAAEARRSAPMLEDAGLLRATGGCAAADPELLPWMMPTRSRRCAALSRNGFPTHADAHGLRPDARCGWKSRSGFRDRLSQTAERSGLEGAPRNRQPHRRRSPWRLRR